MLTFQISYECDSFCFSCHYCFEFYSDIPNFYNTLAEVYVVTMGINVDYAFERNIHKTVSLFK